MLDVNFSCSSPGLGSFAVGGSMILPSVSGKWVRSIHKGHGHVSLFQDAVEEALVGNIGSETRIFACS